jgi:hypothetical protein
MCKIGRCAYDEEAIRNRVEHTLTDTQKLLLTLLPHY